MDYQQDLRQEIQLKKEHELAEALPLFQGLQVRRPKDPYLLSNFGHLYFLMGNVIAQNLGESVYLATDFTD